MTLTPLIQQWLTVAGLACDGLGFLLLLREWYIAFFSEARQLELEMQLERQRSLRHFSQKHASDTLRSHLEQSGRMMDEMAINRARNEHAAARTARRTAFILSAILIALGFVLQVAGAWPL